MGILDTMKHKTNEAALDKDRWTSSAAQLSLAAPRVHENALFCDG